MPKKTNQWEIYSEKYLERASEINDPFKRIVDSPSFLKLLGNLNYKRILDLGCGNGEFCKAMKVKGGKVTGVDGSASMIKLARQILPLSEFQVLDLRKEKLPFLPSSFDIVTAKLFLMYLPSLTNVLKDINRILKNNGLLAIDLIHPLRPFIFSSKIITKKYLVRQPYLKESSGKIVFSEEKFDFFYRPISWYLNKITSCGFIFLKSQEIVAGKNFVKKFPEENHKQNLPVTLHLLFKKP